MQHGVTNRRDHGGHNDAGVVASPAEQAGPDGADGDKRRQLHEGLSSGGRAADGVAGLLKNLAGQPEDRELSGDVHEDQLQGARGQENSSAADAHKVSVPLELHRE
jgi:hypothetical protein